MTGRPLLVLAASVASLNAALLASASAETCVTGVNPTFTNAVSGITGNPGTTVVTGATPTTASALTNVTANPGAVPFLTSATTFNLEQSLASPPDRPILTSGLL